jgi:predicted MFS family arabinose efflux permease
LAATANILILFFPDVSMVSVLRFGTGFFLAGIYPVGMKIAAEKFPDKLGNALGFLVGALVLGTSLPHLLDEFGDWKMVAFITSILAAAGGLVVWIFIPSGLPGIKNIFNPKVIPVLFQSKNFKRAAFGYFGHMWELYAFWAFVPLIIEKFNQQQPAIGISQFSFIVIAIGCAGCIAGGLLSKKYGSKSIAMLALLVSLISCLLIPFALQNSFLFLTLMVIWGFSVVADSPQFSTMVAQSAPAEYKGTALTIVTCIGFAITIVSIQLLKLVFENDIRMIWILIPGPLVGLWFTKQFKSV